MKLLNKFSLTRKITLGLIFAGIFFGASCLKKQNLNEESLGDSVPPEQIAAALGDGFGPIDYSQIHVNDKSSIVLSQSIQDGAAQILQQQDVTIQSVNNTPSTLELSVLSATTSYSGGQTSQSSRVWNKIFNKYNGFAFSMNHDITAADAQADEPLFMFQVIQNLALGSCYDDGNYPETCHNLTVTDVDYKVPSSAAHQHACPDIFNCYIKAKHVEFDLVRKYEIESDGKPKRIHYTFVLSPLVPFTSRVLQYCSRSLYDITGVPQKVLADICYNVNSYTFGQ